MTKVLLVEDDKSLREIYGVRLLAEGYDIVSAGDGEEALAMAIKEKPQLIISDVMMPKISGFDMLDILRSTTETRDIKVIMMTALSSDDQRARGEQLGADKYLVKSQVGIEDVVRTVHEVLEDKSGTSVPVAPVSSDAAAPSEPAPAPASDDTKPADDKPADDKPTTDPAASNDDTVASATAPGNDNAGPLPPQPSEIKPLDEVKPAENTLPQPTAPFSSPRPVNLGEDAMKPDEPVEVHADTEPVVTEPVITSTDEKEIALTSSGLGFEASKPDDESEADSATVPPVIGESSPSVEPLSTVSTDTSATETPATGDKPDDAPGAPTAPAV